VRTWLNAYDTGHVNFVLKGGSKQAPGPNLYEWFLLHTRSANAAPAKKKKTQQKPKK
jgi:hypothetical protein